MLLQKIGRDASEAFLLMRRYDSMVLEGSGGWARCWHWLCCWSCLCMLL